MCWVLTGGVIDSGETQSQTNTHLPSVTLQKPHPSKFMDMLCQGNNTNNDPHLPLPFPVSCVLWLAALRGLLIGNRFFFSTQNWQLTDYEEILTEFDKKCTELLLTESKTAPLTDAVSYYTVFCSEELIHLKVSRTSWGVLHTSVRALPFWPLEGW